MTTLSERLNAKDTNAPLIDSELPYELYLNEQLIARARNKAVFCLGDVEAYVHSGVSEIDVFTVVYGPTAEILERSNSRFDLWDKETDSFRNIWHKP